MPWEEFKQLLSGISSDTPLGRVVSIRSETDRKVLRRFTKEQRRIRNEWMQRKVKRVSESDMNKILEGFKKMFKDMSGR